MTLLLDMINGIHKFLGYLDISPKYLNRAYTILSIIPTAYILRIVYGLFLNQNYVQATLYSIGFLILVYFWILNIFYYFLDKNVKGDVTQVFVKVLPDEVFNIAGEEVPATQIDHLQTEKVPIDFDEDYQLILADYVQTLINQGTLQLHPLKNGFALPKNTLYPYYFVKQQSVDRYVLQIGTSYNEMTPVGTIQWKEERTLEPVGLFITGGDFVKNDVTYHEPYGLKLYSKKAASLEEADISRRAYRKQKK